MTERGELRDFGGELHATCVIQVFGDNGVPARVEAVVDTGFSGFLALRSDLIKELGLSKRGFTTGLMADGSLAARNLYSVQLEWHGDIRAVEVASLDGLPLIGLALLRGSELRMMVEDRGVIEITPFGEL